MKKLISTKAPSFWSFKVIAIWLLFWGTLAFAFSYSRGLVGLFGGIGALGGWFMNTLPFSKRVQELRNIILEDGCLYVWESSVRRYPFLFSDIDSIKKRNYLWLKFFEIKLKKDIPVGRTIRFIPAKHIFPKGKDCDLLEEFKRLTKVE